MREISTKAQESQTVEKSALIIAGTTLISSGIALIPTKEIIGVIIVVLGVVCLIVRELIKLKQS